MLKKSPLIWFVIIWGNRQYAFNSSEIRLPDAVNYFLGIISTDSNHKGNTIIRHFDHIGYYCFLLILCQSDRLTGSSQNNDIIYTSIDYVIYNTSQCRKIDA